MVLQQQFWGLHCLMQLGQASWSLIEAKQMMHADFRWYRFSYLLKLLTTLLLQDCVDVAEH